ncbi:MAG: DNA alkylation repair protein, partial [Sulfurovum sp. 28-43-6]
EIKAVFEEFKQEMFEEAVLSRFGELELKERIYHIRDMLSVYLPDDFEHATKLLLASLPQELDSSKTDDDFGDFIYAPYGEFIAYHGCCESYVDVSLGALREVTKRFSVEYAIRDFINVFPDETLKMLEACARSPHYHERRLASEGLRPKLPWGKKITLKYTSALGVLEVLFTDKTRFVTRSVANHLNDLSKIDPGLHHATRFANAGKTRR